MKALKSELAKTMVRFDYKRMVCWDKLGKLYKMTVVPKA